MMEPKASARRPGLFVTFEGGEGVGKSTQMERLARRLRSRATEVVTTREPGGAPRAELIRDFLLAGGAREFGPLAEAMLFAAARAEHVDRTIGPALEAGKVVLCDRFTDSTRVYQGVLGAIPGRSLDLLERLAVDDVRPDLTLIFDLPAAEGLKRARSRREARGEQADRFEHESLAFHERVLKAFRDIAEREHQRCRLIDAAQAVDRVEELVAAAVEAHLTERSKEPTVHAR